MTSMAEAIQEAVRSEQVGARFYKALAGTAGSTEARDFLMGMAREEEDHCESLRQLGSTLSGEEWITPPGATFTVPQGMRDWEGEDEGLTLEEAMEIAIEAEHHSAALYGMMAEHTDGHVSRFFSSMALNEQVHARRLQELLDRLLEAAGATTSP